MFTWIGESVFRRHVHVFFRMGHNQEFIISNNCVNSREGNQKLENVFAPDPLFDAP
jgi:hypothetical protein